MATFVIVHGAFDGGWAWRQVAAHLRMAGHEVFTPTLTGSGERVHLARPDIDLNTHIQDIYQRAALRGRPGRDFGWLQQRWDGHHGRR